MAKDASEFGSVGLLRHRQLKCTKKGFDCTEDNCCGKAECVEGLCCIPDGVKGCDGDADCCGELTCGQTVDSMCGDGTTEGDGGRPCFIHGEVCDGNEESNTCCGNKKYSCEIVNVAEEGEGATEASEDTQCCIPTGGKGCSKTSHCCGSMSGNFCDEESRCVEAGGSIPTDAPGGRNCGLKGDTCDDASECCGSKKYDCQDGKCCIVTGNNGCGGPEDCCSGICDLGAQLCVLMPT
uniref:Uncharacterized protein n=1 Tax=Amphora coffeiformis TaxID=265554 RepID=A0A7S3L069_9STRA|eukprot:scaffold638_cov168-Amphora_coffeaeformis.AAC.26